MNNLFLAALALLGIGLTEVTLSAGDYKSNVSAKTEHTSPLACNVFALSPETRNRHFDELGPALLKLKKSMRELPDGYEFEFPADSQTYQLLTEWMLQERLCCPFLRIELRLESEGGAFWLKLTGRPGTKEFIQADASAWVHP
jgi:hypothetical protein